MKQIIVSLLILLGYISTVKGQDVLSMVTDARTSAMGDVGLSQSADPFSLYNYAGVIALDSCSGSVGYSFGGWMPSQKMHIQHTVAGYWKLAKHHSFSTGVRYFSYPEINSSGDDGFITSQFTPFDLTVDLGYGYAITSNLSVATTVRYVTGKVSDVEGSKAGSALGVDLGFYFRKNRINAGLALSNIGTKINYGGEDNSMPARVKVAGGYSLLVNNKHTVNGTLEIAYAFLPKNYTGFETGIGVEYIYNKLLAVRAGYRLGNSENNPTVVPDNFGSSLSYATLGLGLNLWKCTLDASYLLSVPESPVRNSFRLSLGVRF
jgi:hypothetical protein